MNKNLKMHIDVRELLISSKYSEPTFFVNFYKVVRPSSRKNHDFTYKIQKSKSVNCWKVENEKLIKIPHNYGVFFDAEAYIVQWLFDIEVDNTVLEESLVYYWKGQQSPKGFSPLPPEIEEHSPVERIVQWSEPALFFYCFPYCTFTFSGRENAFDSSAPHLFLIRGELVQEIHLYEVPCEKASLRSRAIFLLVTPKKQQFLYWHGSSVPYKHRENIVNISQPHKTLQEWHQDWASFELQEIEEHSESVFLETVQGNISDFIHVKVKADFSPKLFYLNSITGSFSATEVEYPLRAENVIASFPFLQSHLYTATQPALFLLDNNTEIWLWEGIKEPTCENNNFEEELKIAKELIKNYIKEKENLISERVMFNHVFANSEPLAFKNIFPYWKEN